MKIKLLLFVLTLSTTSLWSQINNSWTNEDNTVITLSKSNHQSLNNYRVYSLDTQALKSSLLSTPYRNNSNSFSNVIVAFPNHKGNMMRYRISESSTMHPDLQARYPEIKSYLGQGIDSPTSQIRFSLSPYGFSAMILSPENGNTFIESSQPDSNNYGFRFQCDASGNNDQIFID
ncbi:hypothetical protein OAU59_02410 [Winogradskyella sp.]|nr:hypothetical protein [Winogradskyella sp.]